jgi:hypothetical protein
MVARIRRFQHRSRRRRLITAVIALQDALTADDTPGYPLHQRRER